jgi:hypothetical protein
MEDVLRTNQSLGDISIVIQTIVKIPNPVWRFPGFRRELAGNTESSNQDFWKTRDFIDIF